VIPKSGARFSDLITPWQIDPDNEPGRNRF